MGLTFNTEAYAMVKDLASNNSWFDYDPSLLSEEKTPSMHNTDLSVRTKAHEENQLKVKPSFPATTPLGYLFNRSASCSSAASNMAVD